MLTYWVRCRQRRWIRLGLMVGLVALIIEGQVVAQAVNLLLVGVGRTVVAQTDAPANATYIVQTADATLTNEQALGALTTGLVKNTTTTGVLSIAASPADYSVSTYAVLSANRTTAVTTYADITDLSFSLAASTRYLIECRLRYDANATTTGIGIGWTGPASPTFTTGSTQGSLTASTIGGTVVAGNDTGGTTTGSAATTANHAHFVGVWSNGANAGTLQMRFKSEVAVASAIIIQAGSVCSATVY